MFPVRRMNEPGWFPGVFNDFFASEWPVRANATTPSVNILEEEKAYRVEVAAPGMTKEDFSVRLQGDNLVISMEKKDESKTEKDRGGKYLRREFSYSRFKQAFTLPDDVDRKHISAGIADGVLSVELPKRQAEDKPDVCQEIEIH